MKFSLIVSSFLIANTWCYSQNKPSKINSGKQIEKYSSFFEDSPQLALDALNKIGMSDTNYFKSMHLKSILHYSNKKYSKAIECSNEIIKYNVPEYLEYAYNIKGLCLNSDDKSKEALDVYKEANKVLPNKYLLEFNMAVVYEKLGQYPEAVQKYKRTLELNPIYQPAYIQLGYLAANEGYLTLAFQNLCIGAIFNTSSSKAHGVINYLDKLSENETELESKGIPVSAFGNDYSKIDQLIKNKVAISNKYKFKSKLKDFSTIKQLHLICEQLKKQKNNTESRHAALLDRVFTDIIPAGDFDDFVGALFLDGNYSTKVNKTVNSNKSNINAFLNKFVTEVLNEYETIDIEFQNKTVNTQVKRGDGSTYILSFGKEENDLYKDDWTYFNKVSQVKSKGGYNSEMNREGLWEFYKDGKLYEDVSYVNHEMQGENKGYFQNGSISYIINYKDNVLHGPYTLYYTNGQKKFEGDFVDGVLEGKIKRYYSNGALDEEYSKKDKKIEGEYISKYINGKIYFKGNYVDGNLVGDVKYFHRNGNPHFTVTYNDKGLYNGVKKEYFWDGSLEKEGTYENGKAVGLHKENYKDGSLYSEANYDVGGKKEGGYTIFYRTGEVKSKSMYKSGKLMSIVSYAKDGSELHNSGAKKGNFNIKVYGELENCWKQGAYKKGVQEGLFQFIDDYGYVNQKDEYKNGEVDGDSKVYYFDGSLKSEGTYKEGKKDGLFTFYGPEKEVEYSGYYIEGKGEGDWYYYFPDGKIKSITNFKNDKRSGFDRDFDKDGNVIKLRHESNRNIVNQYFLPDGTMYYADTLFDKSGTSKTFFTNGNIESNVEFINSNEEGKFVEYFSNGKISRELTLIKGRKEGEAKAYYESGQVKYVLNYKNNKRVGEQLFYFENGKLSSKEHYDDQGNMIDDTSYTINGEVRNNILYTDGLKNGPSKFYVSGKLVLVRNYMRGVLVSYSYLSQDGKLLPAITINKGTVKIKTNYQSGKKAVEMNINSGSFEGEYKRYFEDGTIQYSATYYFDELEGETISYSKSGVLYTKHNYSRGLKHGKCEFYDENGKLKRVSTYYYGNKYGDELIYNVDGSVKETRTYNHDIQLF